MSEDWAAAAADIAAGLEEAGGEASLVQVTRTGGSAADPESGTPTTVLHTMKALETDFETRELASGSVQTGDIKIMTTVPDIEPTKTLPMRWAGHDYSVQRFQRLAPNGSDVLAYFWHLRP